MAEFRIETERLALRSWRSADAEPFLAMGRDSRVMEFLGPPLGWVDVDAAIARQENYQRRHGHCFWAVERREDGAFLGFCGIKPGPEETPLEGRIEIGWRLAHHAWGQGYAREAAQASLDWGFGTLPAAAIWAITVPGNVRSWGLMERLGMVRQGALDFDHPDLAPGHRLRQHIVYAAQRPDN